MMSSTARVAILMRRAAPMAARAAWARPVAAVMPQVAQQNPQPRFLSVSSQRDAVVPFHLSDIGEGIKEVTVKEWFIKEGDSVAQFDQICEVQSDKASVTITSRFDGVVKKLYYEVDEIAQTGDPLVDIEVADDGAAGVEGSSQGAVEVLETDAIQIGEAGARPGSGAVQGKVLATPAVRRVAQEHKVDLTKVQGTGKAGRILKDDVFAFLESPVAAAAPVAARAPCPAAPRAAAPAPAPAAAPTPAPVIRRPPTVAGQDRTEPFSIFTKAMTKAMTESLNIPHFGYKDEIDMSKLVELRKELKQDASERGIKLSYMPFILKAASLALSEYPVINSSIDVQKETVLYRAAHNIGVAMDTPMGLLVPNIKSVQDLSVFEIATELNRMSELGARGKLGGDDLKNGSFSISNIGSIGGTYTMPVIAPPNVAIGALGKIQKLPRFDEEDNLVKAHVMNVSWSADHRVIDGATMARFSNVWKHYLEHPASMLLMLR